MRGRPAFRHCTNSRRALRHMMISFIFAVLLLGGCSSSYHSHPPAGSISGRVVDPQDHAVAGVKVRLGNRVVGITDRNGTFVIRAVPDDRLAVSFSARNYIDTTRVYDTRRNSSITDVLVIWPRSAPLSLNAARGGTLTFPSGIVTIPPRALVDGRKRLVKGDVRVSFSAFDVTDPLQYRSAPGDFTARMRDNSIRKLETFGVFEIYVEDTRGNRVDLAEGQRAEVELAVPRSLRPPETVGSYRFEQTSGLWVEAGTFRRTERSALASTLSTFASQWNADDVMNTTCIQVTADCDCIGVSTSNFQAQGQGVSYAHSFTAVKDECVNVKTNATLTLTPVHNNMNPVPVEITTPSKTTTCDTPSACRKVTFRCPRQLPINATLNSCADPDWYCADGYANDGPQFGVVWKQQQILFASGGGAMTLGLQPCTSNCSGKSYEAAELQSTCYYGYGIYEAKFQAAKGTGVLTSFFVYTGPGDGPRQDEIDIEIFGRPGTDKGCASGQSALQTNYFVNGQEYPKTFCLPYDATQVSRRYGFEWRANAITWYADKDGNDVLDPTDVLRTALSSNGPLPTQPGKIMVNMWAASTDPLTVQWMGAFTYSASNPNVAIYDEILYKP
jgi:endo-1,3-1,4-beta-glycanase ExoK